MINWNESSSKASAINTQNVKISLSYDAGLTFSYVLAETTPNDGSEKVTLPILANTTSARIKVEPVGNIYYAINKVNFEITNPLFYMWEKPCCQRTVCPTPRIIQCTEKISILTISKHIVDCSITVIPTVECILLDMFACTLRLKPNTIHEPNHIIN